MSPPSIDDLRSDISELATSSASAAKDDERIREAASRRRDEISIQIDQLRPKVVTDTAAAHAYDSLIGERGRLDMVLARPSAA